MTSTGSPARIRRSPRWPSAPCASNTGPRAIARRVVDQPKFAVADVVVDCLWHADSQKVESVFFGQLGNLLPCPRVVAANVQQIPDLVRPNTSIAVGNPPSGWTSIYSGRCRWTPLRGESQKCHFLGDGPTDQQLLLQNASMRVEPVDGSDGVRLPGGLNDPPQAAVDHRVGPPLCATTKFLAAPIVPTSLCEKARFYCRRERPASRGR